VEQLSRFKAEKVLAAVNEQFADKFDPDAGPGDKPTLYEPGFHADGWTIAWEGNPEWTLQALQDKKIKGVFTEPVNHWCLGLYPA
jgi:hypothetical protein